MKNYGIVGLLTVLLVSSCGEKEGVTEKAPIRVKTEVAGQATTDARLEYVGIVEEKEATAVSFTGMGVVRRVLVNEGQTVQCGQLIAEMDDTQAQNLLRGAEAQMNQANDALERFKMLHDNGSLPEVQWVEIQSKVAQAKAQYEVARKNLTDCQLTAPVSGIIGKKLVGAGETALPSQAIVTILDINSVKVKVSVPESEISNVTASTPTTIEVEAAHATTSGGKIEKGIQADALTHTYDVRIQVPNADHRLLPGMVANVRMTTDDAQTDEGLSLPVTAIQKSADGALFVWTVTNDGSAHRTQVNIGATHGNRASISQGLTPGQRVVTEGYQKLSEGTRVVFLLKNRQLIIDN